MRREGIGRAVSWHCLSCQIFFAAPMLPTEIAASEDEGFINNWIELTADIQKLYHGVQGLGMQDLSLGRRLVKDLSRVRARGE